MLPARHIRTLLPVALTLLLATLEACGGPPVSAGPDGGGVGDALAASSDASAGDGGMTIVVVGDAGASQPADADAASAADAGLADTADGAAATTADSAPDEGSDAAADVSTPDAPVVDAAAVPDAAVADAAVPVDASVVEAGPVCTSVQLLCGGACVAIDTNNCGTCGTQCTGATPVCGATAGAYACTSGCATTESRCGNVCVDTANDSSNCGSCGHTCSVGETCQAGVCACPPGETLCGSACTPTATDDANCGTCGHACVGGQSCHSGTCACPAGQTVCGSVCTSEATDDANCGTCGHACIGGETCQSGTCVCPSGQSFCGSACTSESTDNGNCGACGHACVGGETCQSGVCECPSGLAFCGSACTSESTDPNNCGACGHACLGGETCQSGTCACPSGETLCSGICVAEASDANNCGACGHGCLGGTCSGGMCQPVLLTTPGGNVEDVATDGTYVYWTTNGVNGSVGKCEIASCAATATNLATDLRTVSPIAVDPVEERVFFGDIPSGNDVGLWYVPTNGGAPKSWGPSIGQVDAIWIAPSSVYYWTGRNGGVYLSNGGGSYIGNVMTGDCLYGVATDSGHVYAADSCGGRLLSCPIASACGSSPAVVATGIAGPDKLYYDGSTLWLTAVGTTLDNYVDGALYKCSPTGCSLFASAQAGAQGVVSDGTNVYWTDPAGGAVMRSTTGTAAPFKIASAVDPGGIAQTTTAIMWGSQTDGGVYLLAK